MTAIKATFVFPDGTKKELEIPDKVFKSGKTGWYVRLPKIQAEGKTFSGQVQVWES